MTVCPGAGPGVGANLMDITTHHIMTKEETT